MRKALGISDPDQIFYDESSLHLGDAWLELIQKEVITRPIFIVILSSHSVVADYVRMETNLALRKTITHHERRIYSVLIEECNLDKLAPMLGGYQMANVMKKGYEVALDELVNALRGGPGAGKALQPPPQVAAAMHSPRAKQARQLAEDAQASLEARRWTDAISKADSALSLPENVANAEPLAVLALAYAGSGQWERARDAATRALEIDPLRFDVWKSLARAETALGQPTEALAALDRALALAAMDEDDNTATLELLGERRALQIQGQQWATALDTLNEELQLAPDDPVRLDVCLNLLQRLGRDPEALDRARDLTARPNATFEQWLTRARLARRTGAGIDEVRAALQAAAQLAPADAALSRARHELLLFEPRKIGEVEVILPITCDVPEGEFLMGSDLKVDKEATADEQPQQRVVLPAFQIGRYPVTVVEYACFVRTGYREPRDWQGQLHRLDHPVVNVSWRDAVAYVTWLAKLTGEPWRLPTEAEWEKAARWDPAARQARIYPWGNVFELSCCNSSEAGKGTTTPVGSYPSGTSPYKALDMAGNVWEWTSSLYQRYPYRLDDGKEPADPGQSRILRGGSWNTYQRNVRSAYREPLNPDNLVVNGIGFRVARTLPSS
jgi:formylglycine-generating enzyme required for sulfatase activity